ncbi:DUF4446 family protein [Nocardiopsis dassonvillei]|uniref:DUF4446 family protein n=1 Tax=Nocardiopsis dassonvillei TaxID=2014 RepID=UPI003645623E
MFTTILALTGMLSGLGALALGWHALSRTRVVGSESQALAQRAAAVSASGVDPFAVRDVAVLHYDALEEMSGARSFSLALLNSEGDGVVVTSINGRTESRTYAKAVVGGECDTLLSPEEYRVVRSARLGEGVGAAATAGGPPARAASSAGGQPVTPAAPREEPGFPSARDEERGARGGADAVDEGSDRERREAAPAASAVPGDSAARTASTAPTTSAVPSVADDGREDVEDAPAASAVPNGTGATRENVEPAPAGPSARTARATEPVADDSREASEAAPVPSDATGDQREAPVTGATSAPSTRAASTGTSVPGVDQERAEAAPAAPRARTIPATPADTAAPGGDREPRGLVSVIRRTIGRAGADRRPPVEAVRSGVGAARPIVSANVTVRPGPSAAAAGSTGTSVTGTATAAEPRPEAPADEGTGGEGTREADAPAPEARG